MSAEEDLSPCRRLKWIGWANEKFTPLAPGLSPFVNVLYIQNNVDFFFFCLSFCLSVPGASGPPTV